jgi:hypothetical protein
VGTFIILLRQQLLFCGGDQKEIIYLVMTNILIFVRFSCRKKAWWGGGRKGIKFKQKNIFSAGAQDKKIHPEARLEKKPSGYKPPLINDPCPEVYPCPNNGPPKRGPERASL